MPEPPSRSAPPQGDVSADAPATERAATLPVPCEAGGDSTVAQDPEAQALAAARSVPAPGTPRPIAPGYEILAELGRGGMGVVYQARDVRLNRLVALKLVLSEAADARGLIRFLAEAEAVAAVRHAHVVEVYEYGEAGGCPFIALEYLPGGSLAARLVAGAAGEPRTTAKLIGKIARGLGAAHALGIVHRDVKPGNVLFDETGEPKVADFGLAKRGTGSDLTATQARMGTPAYMSPEQAGGNTKFVGPATDVWALGVILYELLTGTRPFLAEDAQGLYARILTSDPVPPRKLAPSVPRDLELICLKCLAKPAHERYATAQDLADDLDRFLRHEPIAARPAGRAERFAKWVRRNKAAAGAVAAVALALVAAAGVSFAFALRSADDARRAHKAESDALELAGENTRRRADAETQNDELKRQGERIRRTAFALQLGQIAAMYERDPSRSRALLEDESKCPADLRDFTWAYLRRLCERQERLYAEHSNDDPLHAVAYSPTGVFVATAGDAVEVRLWNPGSGCTWAVLVGNTRRVLDVAVSPDGGVVATAGADGTVRLWSLPTGVIDDARRLVDLLRFPEKPESVVKLKPTVTVAAHSTEVNCLAFSPDGGFLVSGGEDGSLKRWDVRGFHPSNARISVAGAAGAVAAALTHAMLSPQMQPVCAQRDVRNAHAGGVKAVAFAANGSVLVSGGADRTATVWSPDLGVRYRSYKDHADAVLAVAVSPNGRVIATANNAASPVVRLINLDTGRERRLIGHTGAIYTLAMSEEGDLLASAGFDKSVRLWDVNNAQERGVLLGHDLAVAALAFAPDRRTVVSASMDATARVWQTAARPSEEREFFSDQRLSVVAVSANGTTYVGGDEQGRVRIGRPSPFSNRGEDPAGRDPYGITPVLNTRLPGGRVRAVAASGDGQVALASTNSGLFLWPVVPEAPTRSGGTPGGGQPPSSPVELRVPRTVYSMHLDETGHRLVTLDAEGVCVWDLRRALAARPGGDPLSAEGPGLIHRVRFPQEVAMPLDGRTLALIVGNGVRLIDLEGKTLADMPSAHAVETRSVAFGRDSAGTLLATADTKGVVKVWRVGADGALSPVSELEGHTTPILGLAFTPEGRTLASAGIDRTVLLSDPLTGQERAALTGHADSVLLVQFLPDASGLLTLARDGRLRRW